MAGSDSDGRVATTLLTEWLRYLLGNARHRPITAQDLVFRDLYALVADHPSTKGPLSELYDEIRRFAVAPDDVALGLLTTIDTVSAEDPTFATQLEELLHVLRPLTPDEPPQPGGYFTDPGLVAPVLGHADDYADHTADDHPYFATSPDLLVTLADDADVAAAVAAMLAETGADVTARSAVGDLRVLHVRPTPDEATCLRHLGPVLVALRPLAEATVRVGALLIVKTGPGLIVRELTPAQRDRFDREPGLAGDPHTALAALRPDEGFTTPA